MAFTDLNVIDTEPVGAGNPGNIKVISVALTGTVAKNVYFGKHKLVDPDNAIVLHDLGHDNGSGETIQGSIPDTTVTIHSSGEYISLEDAGGGNFIICIIGNWTER